MRDREAMNRIPVLEAGVTDLLADLGRADITIDEIATRVSRSPSIAARVIACANSAWSNPVTPVASVKDACMRLGLKVVRTTVIALAVGNSFDQKSCPAFKAREFWARSIVRSNLAAAIAAERNLDVNIAQTAGLLNSIGLLWLVSAMPEEANEALTALASGTCENLDDAFEIYGAMSVAEATLGLFEAWEFPAVLIATISGNVADIGDCSDDEMGQCVQLSSKLSGEIMRDVAWDESAGPESDPDLEAIYAAEQATLPKTLELAQAIR